MKKRRSLIALTVLISAFSLACYGCFDENAPEREECEFSREGVGAIEITLSVSDVTVVTTEGDAIKVSYYATPGGISVESVSGTLSVRSSDDAVADGKASGSVKKKYRGVNIELPAGYSGDIGVTTVSGDVTLSGLSELGRISVDSGSGDVKVVSTTCSSLTIGTVASDAVLERVEAETFDVHSVTGDVSVCGLVCGEAKVRGDASDIGLFEVSAGGLSVETLSGDVKLGRCEFGGALTVNTAAGAFEGKNVYAGVCTVVTMTGDISFRSVGVGSKLTAVSDTGDVTAALTDAFEDFTIDVKSDYGKNKLKGIVSRNGPKRLEIKTVTGDISVYFPDGV